MRWPPWLKSSQCLVLLLLLLTSAVQSQVDSENDKRYRVVQRQHHRRRQPAAAAAASHEAAEPVTQIQTKPKNNRFTPHGYYEQRADGVIVYHRVKCYPQTSRYTTALPQPWNHWRGRSYHTCV